MFSLLSDYLVFFHVALIVFDAHFKTLMHINFVFLLCRLYWNKILENIIFIIYRCLLSSFISLLFHTGSDRFDIPTQPSHIDWSFNLNSLPQIWRSIYY